MSSAASPAPFDSEEAAIKVILASPSLYVLPLYYRHARVFESSRQEFTCSALPQQGKRRRKKKTTISCFYPAEEEQSRQIFGGNFQTRTHDGNKAAGLKVIGWVGEQSLYLPKCGH